MIDVFYQLKSLSVVVEKEGWLCCGLVFKLIDEEMLDLFSLIGACSQGYLHYPSCTMAYIKWCLLAFFPYLVVGSFFLNVKNISFTRVPDLNVAIKVLNVAEELERETLPLKMGQRIYKIQGLKESAWYEVKISYPASIPASFSLELKKNLTEQKVPISRRLLNTEKIIFKFDRNNWNSGKDEAFVLVIVEPAGVVAKPNVQNEEFVMFNIICEELALGIPHRAWWVGVAALLCLLLAAVIPYYLPPQLMLRIQDMGNDSVVKNS